MQVMTENEETNQRLSKRLHGTYFEFIGTRIIQADEDACIGEIDVLEHHLNPGGQLHGGLISSLADSICGLGTQTNLPADAKGFATIEFKINLISTAAVGETIRCVAVPVHRGRQTQVWDAEVVCVSRGDKRVAIFRCTQTILR